MEVPDMRQGKSETNNRFLTSVSVSVSLSVCVCVFAEDRLLPAYLFRILGWCHRSRTGCIIPLGQKGCHAHQRQPLDGAEGAALLGLWILKLQWSCDCCVPWCHRIDTFFPFFSLTFPHNESRAFQETPQQPNDSLVQQHHPPAVQVHYSP